MSNLTEGLKPLDEILEGYPEVHIAGALGCMGGLLLAVLAILILTTI